MAAVPDHPQRIGRLTPLLEGCACIDRLVRPVQPRLLAAVAAYGRVAACDVAVGPRPPTDIALRDGWAVRSEQTLGAGSYAPAPLALAPVHVDAGDPMPAGTDAITDDESVRRRGAGWEALAGVTSGDGVLPAGADAMPDAPAVRSGQRLRQTDLAALAVLGVTELQAYEPRIRLAPARADERLTAIARVVGDLAHADGAAADLLAAEAGIEAALAPDGTDLMVLVGGTGTGTRDGSVSALAARGRVEFHGVALCPGETAAFGMIEATPVLIVPGRLDPALATWLTLGRQILARRCGRAPDEPAVSGVLSRKVTSNLGVAELVLLAQDGGALAPVAAGYLSPSTLAQADGYLLVPADSEGYPAGTRIDMRLLP